MTSGLKPRSLFETLVSVLFDQFVMSCLRLLEQKLKNFGVPCFFFFSFSSVDDPPGQKFPLPFG